jgi:hypothetical protein
MGGVLIVCLRAVWCARRIPRRLGVRRCYSALRGCPSSASPTARGAAEPARPAVDEPQARARPAGHAPPRSCFPPSMGRRSRSRPRRWQPPCRAGARGSSARSATGWEPRPASWTRGGCPSSASSTARKRNGTSSARCDEPRGPARPGAFSAAVMLATPGGSTSQSLCACSGATFVRTPCEVRGSKASAVEADDRKAGAGNKLGGGRLVLASGRQLRRTGRRRNRLNDEDRPGAGDRARSQQFTDPHQTRRQTKRPRSAKCGATQRQRGSTERSTGSPTQTREWRP